LLIRQAKLNESRAMLQRIVRWEEANPEVRCRAQWLIGETFLMQKQYRNAIDAYRRVEAMEASQQWVPAALVQAGRAFEKLGRSREASMCYSGLLQRFADSEHALVARDRLASMRDATTLR
jgi:TolA-binding protein